MRRQSQYWPPERPPKRGMSSQFLAVVISILLSWALIFATFGLAVLSFRWMIGVI